MFCCRFVFSQFMEEKKRTAKFRKSRVRVILYTEEHSILTDHTNEGPEQLLTET